MNAQAGHATSGQFYEITTPGGRALAPPAGRCWSVTQPRLAELIADNRVWFGLDGMNVPRLKAFRSEATEGLTPHTLWKAGEVGTNDSAKKHLLDLVADGALFDTPKPVELIQRIVEIAAPGSDDLVLDFFAGSGTTAEAVIRANSADGKNRSFVLVQLPEPTEDSATPTLAALARHRVRAAGKRIADAPPVLGGVAPDTGFRAYRLTPSNFHVWKSEVTAPEDVAQQLGLLVDHLVEGNASEAVLSELLLKAGYRLTSPTVTLTLGGASVNSVADGALLVCLVDPLTIEVFEAMVAVDPAMILVLDAGFAGDDELKVNALQTVRARNQSTSSDIVLRVV